MNKPIFLFFHFKLCANSLVENENLSCYTSIADDKLVP